ncbi:MAG: FecR domain-containing protein [Bacteroidota bacterium]
MKDQYKTYKVSDFAADASFINWVKGNAPQDKERWTNWLAQNPDKIEDIQQAKTLVQAMVFKEPNMNAINTQALWSKIDQALDESADEKPLVTPGVLEKVKENPTPQVVKDAPKVKSIMPEHREKVIPKKEEALLTKWKTPKYLYPILGISAAASLLAIMLFTFLMPDNIKIETLNAVHLDYPLPDQSLVTLNATSTLVLDTTNWADNRTLFLEGEAFFDVTEGSPFRVETDQGDVQVLGTSFNVFQREERFKVACITGKVEVSHLKQKIILNPGEYAYLDGSGTLIKDSTGNRNPDGWMQDVYSFTNEPVSEAFKEIERQFGVKVDIQTDRKDSLYRGFFNGRSLEDALDNVCFTMKLEYDINLKEKLVIITNSEE